MGFINVAERTISAKLVYYGVGVGGKTTSLQQVHGILCPRNEVQLVSINTEEDSTLLFDFLPINLGSVGGFKIRIQGFTVPGQPKYRQMRKYVLQGADAVVFVVDSQRSRLQENIESLQSMREQLRAASGPGEDLPIVVQYNKRDLPDVLPESELDKHFKFRKDIETFPTVATEGQGVFEAFVHATGLLVEGKVALYGVGRGVAAAKEIADGTRGKLWEICDHVRHDRAVVTARELPQTRLAVKEQPPAPAVQAPPQQPAKDDGKRKGKKGKHGPEPVLAEGDFELRYQLRDSADLKQEVAQVLTDEDLDLDLVKETLGFATDGIDERDDSLLDKTVQSNVELARRFGDLDERRLLLERKVRDLVEIAQNTVHDLNKPVSAIRLMLTSIKKGYLGDVTTPVRQAVANGLLAVQQMERLIQDLVVSSRLDHDGMQLDFKELDMTLLLGDVVQTLRYEIELRNVQVRVEPLPRILGDAWALTKVFMNLVGNAIQYGKCEGKPIVHVSAEDLDSEWRFVVRDNGIGIPAKDQDRLFRRFERGSNTGGISGTGLGLHIVKEIVQGHGGAVHFESEEGKGTSFFLQVPKRPVQAEHSTLSETAERADL